MKHILILSLSCLFFVAACKKDPKPSLNKKSVGDSANHLLSDDDYNKLTIELVSVEGFELSSDVKDDLKTFLESLINKPKGIQIKTSNLENPGLAPYSVDDIVE
ncbi:hypothetical protein GYB22_11670, partial [bacterium]|nr:hypothetical protein [bacterium]